MAADLENGMDLSEFVVEKGSEVEEDKTEEIAEISLSPDLEAEEARKAELREQATKVQVESSRDYLWHVTHLLELTWFLDGKLSVYNMSFKLRVLKLIYGGSDRTAEFFKEKCF